MLITVQILKHLRRLINQHKRPLKHTGAVLLFVPLLHFAVVRPEVKDQVIQDYRQDVTQASQELKTLKQQHTTTKKQLKLKEAVIKAKDVKIKKLTLKPKSNGYGSGGSSAHGCSGYVPGQCVWGVCQWLSWIPDGWGSAYQWDDSARSQGFYVGSKPKVGAVGQTDSNHVVMVLKVAKGKVFVRGMNEAGPWSIKEYWTPTSRWTYIY